MCVAGSSRRTHAKDCRSHLNTWQGINEQLFLHLSLLVMMIVFYHDIIKVRGSREKCALRKLHWTHPKRLMDLTFQGQFLSNLVFVLLQYTFFGLGGMIPFYVPCWVSQWPIIPLLLGRLLMYSFMIVRMHLAFARGSLFSMGYSKRTLTTLMIVMAGTLTLSAGLYLYLQFDSHCSRHLLASLPAIATDTVSSLTLCVLYIRQFWEVYQLTRNMDEEMESEPSEVALTLAEQRKLVRVVSRLTILMLAAVLTTLVFSGILSRWGAAGMYAFDASVNTVCLALSFKRNTRVYRCFCRVCVDCCESPMLFALKREESKNTSKTRTSQMRQSSDIAGGLHSESHWNFSSRETTTDLRSLPMPVDSHRNSNAGL